MPNIAEQDIEKFKTTVGIERERFIIDPLNGSAVPAIDRLLPKTKELARIMHLPLELFHYELFAGQIEDRTLPCWSFENLRNALRINDVVINEACAMLGLECIFLEFMEESQIGNLIVNPFDQRHKEIWDMISDERRLAASRVAATHVHLRLTEDQALRLMNICRKDVIEDLIKLGDHSNGKRIAAYRAMAQTEGVPPLFSSFAELENYIRGYGGERNVWDLVRYKAATQTVEFRMFGATADIEEVCGYVRACFRLYDAFL